MRVAAVFIGGASLFLMSETAWARGKSCREVSDVVGYQHCTHYGNTWAQENTAPIIFELSLGPTWFDPYGRTLHGGFGKYQKGSFQYPGKDVGHNLYAVPLAMRIGGYFAPFVYAGAEFSFGLGGNAMPNAEATGGYQVSGTPAKAANSSSIGGGLYGGLRAPLGYLSIRGEAFFGGREISVSQSAGAPFIPTRTASVSLETWVIEPRVFVDLWATPWMTLSGFGAMNLLHFPDRSMGFAIGFHGRNYDGAFLW